MILLYSFCLENYAKEWCEKLRDPSGPFAPCHFELSPKDYVKVCFDLTVIL